MSEPKIRLTQISPSATGTDSISGNVTITNDLTVGGNLTVSGDTTTLNVQTLLVEDNEIILNSNVTGSPSLNASVTVNRGSSSNAFLLWNEGTDKWGWSDDGNTVTEFATAVLKTGDTMTGLLNVASDLVVTGNVGIGTSSPTDKLQVVGGNLLIGTDTGDIFNSESLLRLQAAATDRAFIQFKTDNNQQAGILFGNVDDDVRGKIEFDNADDSMYFTTGDNVEAMRITSAGELLVGGTTAIAETSGTITIQRVGSPSLRLFRNDTNVITNNSFGFIGFYGNDTTSNTPTLHAYIESVASGTHAAGDNPTDLIFATTPNNTETAVEKMRLNEAGNLGIGTSSPTAKLEVVGSDVKLSGGAGPFTLTLEADTDNVTETDNPKIQLVQDGGLVVARIGFTSTNDIEIFNEWDGTASIVFGTRNTERMRVTDAGLVGIGTSSPNAILNISATGAGSIPAAGSPSTHLAVGNAVNYGTMIGTLGSGVGYIQQQRFDGTATTYDLLLQPNGGNVGIGTSSPFGKLDVYHTAQEVIRVQGGSAAASFIRFADTTNTDIGYIGRQNTSDIYLWQQAVGGAVRIGTENLTRVVVAASGNFGIGTTTPETLLDIAANNTGLTSDTPNNVLRFTDIDTSVNTNQPLGKIEWYTRDATSPGARVVSYILSSAAGTTGGGDIRFGVSPNAGTVAEAARITSGGDLLVGGTSGIGRLSVIEAADLSEANPHFQILGNGYSAFHWLDATAYYIGQNSGSRSLRIYSSAETAGVNLAAGGTSWGTFSDERLKYDVEPVTNAIESLANIRTVKYRLKDVDLPESKKKIGVIAQDLVGVIDEVIDTSKRPDDETDYLNVRYSELIPVLIKAIQEQQAMIEDLKAKVAALEGAN